MHVAGGRREIGDRLLPALRHLHEALAEKAAAFADIVKIGRTHLQDATPLTLGQEFGGYAPQIELGIAHDRAGLPGALPAGARRHRRRHGAQRPSGIRDALRRHASREMTASLHLGAEQVRSARQPRRLVFAHGARSSARRVAVQDRQRYPAAGLRARAPGLGELILPENEPGSSIMPGKVNPTQAEALTMVCVQVMGNHVTISVRRIARAISSSTSSSR